MKAWLDPPRELCQDSVMATGFIDHRGGCMNSSPGAAMSFAARRVVAGLSLAGLLFTAACGPDRDPDAPLIREFRYVGQAPRNALVLLFAARFEDANGDLGGGSLTPFVNRQKTSEQPLALVDLLLDSNLAEHATEGELHFNLEIEMSLDPATRPSEGATFEVGIEIEDAAGKVSNRPRVTLKIDYP